MDAPARTSDGRSRFGGGDLDPCSAATGPLRWPPRCRLRLERVVTLSGAIPLLWAWNGDSSQGLADDGARQQESPAQEIVGRTQGHSCPEKLSAGGDRSRKHDRHRRRYSCRVASLHRCTQQVGVDMPLQPGDNSTVGLRAPTGPVPTPAGCGNRDAHDPDRCPRARSADPQSVESGAIRQLGESRCESKRFLNVVHRPSREQDRRARELHSDSLGLPPSLLGAAPARTAAAGGAIRAGGDRAHNECICRSLSEVTEGEHVIAAPAPAARAIEPR